MPSQPHKTELYEGDKFIGYSYKEPFGPGRQKMVVEVIPEYISRFDETKKFFGERFVVKTLEVKS